MSNTVKLPTCPKCGIPIPKEAPQGLCPKCVLLGAATGTEQGVPATATSEIPSIERIAAAFPQLEILELIGRGGMGFVFKARQPHLDRFVALKLLPDKLAKDAQFAERFNREGRVLAKLNHPNIVSVYDFGQTGGFYYLLMEYIDGVNLRQAMKAGRFSPAEALSIVPKVCEALQYAHEQGILHRDIKPENILLDAKGRVKIADFGIAKLVGEDQPGVTLTNTGAALGTPHYMAPEQLEKPSTVDHRADIYSLGVVFYEMLTGELPIGRFAAPSSKTPVGASVDEVVFRTLEKDRERRFQSAGEMKTQVEHLGDAQPAAASEHSQPSPTWLQRGAAWALGCGLIGCLIPFLSFRQTWITVSDQARTTTQVGWPSPWISLGHLRPDGAIGSSVNLGASSMLFGVGTLLCLIGLMRLWREWPGRSSSSLGQLSRWSIYGAISVGLSLPVPFAMIVAILTGRGGVGPAELWLALGSVAMPGLGGTLLGWLGLNEIRESRGRVKGLPLAMFATLFWPLVVFGGGAVGLPMVVIGQFGRPSPLQTVGRFLVLVLPAAVIAFSFWTIHATARWAGRQPVAQQRGVLKWVFIGVLVIGMGVVLILRPDNSRANLPPPSPVEVTNQIHAFVSDPMTIRTIELRIPRYENNAYWSVGVTTDSELPAGDYLVGLMDRPDGQVDDVLPSTTIYSGGRRPRVTRHVIWSLSKFDTNLVRATDAEMRRTLDGRVIELVIGKDIPVFAITNSQGSATRGRLAVRRKSDDLEEPKPVSVALFETPTNRAFGPFFLNVKIRVSAPLGLLPYAVGELGDGSQPEAHTSIQPRDRGNSSWNGSHCYWYYPPAFGNDALQEVVRQLNAAGAANPNGFQILPGKRVPVFAVTNQAGIIFRGYFALPSIGDSR